MNPRKSVYQILIVGAHAVVAVACQSPTSFPNGFEYIKAKGFDRAMFAQIKSGNTVKNINDQLESLLDVLKKSEMVHEVKVTPTYTIYLETGSSRPSQTISIAVGDDGFGLIEFGHKRAYIYCRELPGFSKGAFQESKIVVR